VPDAKTSLPIYLFVICVRSFLLFNQQQEAEKRADFFVLKLLPPLKGEKG
jgi:hypothetical protein